MPIERSVYLIKNGKTFGPFSHSEIDQFREKGELDKFDWICHNLRQGWVPVAPPPSLPDLAEEVPIKEAAPAIRQPGPIPVSAKKAEEKRGEEKTISALCHHRKTVLSGSIKDVNAEGCTLTRVSPSSMTMPLLKGGASVLLSLLDLQSSQAENVTARITGVVK